MLATGTVSTLSTKLYSGPIPNIIYYGKCAGTASLIFHYMDGTPFVFFHFSKSSKIYSRFSIPGRKQSRFAYSLAQMKNTQNPEYFSFVRAPGIEPGPNPWQGLVLPLNHARK